MKEEGEKTWICVKGYSKISVKRWSWLIRIFNRHSNRMMSSCACAHVHPQTQSQKHRQIQNQVLPPKLHWRSMQNLKCMLHVVWGFFFFKDRSLQCVFAPTRWTDSKLKVTSLSIIHDESKIPESPCSGRNTSSVLPHNIISFLFCLFIPGYIAVNRECQSF